MSAPRAAILSSVKARPGVDVRALALELHMPINTLRYHLRVLVRQGALEAGPASASPPGEASPGRPKLGYQVAAVGQRAFPDADAQTLTGLLHHLIDAGQQSLVFDFFEAHWAQRASAFSQALEARGERGEGARLELVKEALEAEGFMPLVQRSSASPEGRGALRVLARNCPYGACVAVTSLPCQFERAFLQEAVGREVTGVKVARSASEHCSFEFGGAP